VKALQIDLLSDSTEHLRGAEGVDGVALASPTGSPWNRERSGIALLGPTNSGDRSWGQAG
jgi:hypothetical protein